MNARKLVALGLPQECVGVAFEALKASGLVSQRAEATQRIGEVLAGPETFTEDPPFGALSHPGWIQTTSPRHEVPAFVFTSFIKLRDR